MIFPEELWLGAQPDQTSQTKLEWYSLREAQLKAASNGKKLMVLLTDPPCSDCQKLQAQTLNDETTIQRINEYFYPVRIQIERADTVHFNSMAYTTKEFADSFGVTGYPTLLFFNSDGKIISQQGGFMNKHLLRKLLCYIGSDAYKRMEFDQYSINKKN